MIADDSNQPEPGASLAQGRYVLGQPLGTGGMATVYEAHDTVLDRPVAVKTMHAELLSSDDSHRRRFRREAQAVARIGHRGVVAVFDTGEEKRRHGPPVPYIVMELVRGRTLDRVIREDAGGAGLPVRRALALTGRVLAALQASHETGMVHRDVKPSNVMVLPDDEAKVMDFGIVRALDPVSRGHDGTALTGTGLMIGTPQYMSPEQIEGRKDLDGRTDLYSTGVLLFQLLSGRLPFDGDSGFSIGYQHVTQQPPTLVSVGAAVPDAVQALIARALAKAPEQRFPDADTMRHEVDRLAASLGQYGPTAAPSTPPLAGPPAAAQVAPPAASPTAHPVTPPAPSAPPTPQAPFPQSAAAWQGAPQAAAWQGAPQAAAAPPPGTAPPGPTWQQPPPPQPAPGPARMLSGPRRRMEQWAARMSTVRLFWLTYLILFCAFLTANMWFRPLHLLFAVLGAWAVWIAYTLYERRHRFRRAGAVAIKVPALVAMVLNGIAGFTHVVHLFTYR